ncbi:uncharacterized protein GGS22DRAFT_157617 [Annulohypoxylon maeteangense]|uniref:uncharacterized protein n=1 Tax=Annulohypoxylon maeteangense TaxID=1927788 RepID=UPI00200749A0|nr:uncharacterized protein GGS22DRAFT_157617 [Annulohypoxylon maeteangense]KAI0887618.1 hypothetical protein GGS22DRAFT_157617 [Annulohypoxylon maeteangense]
MAPTKISKHPKGADNQKPPALATVAKAKRVLPKFSHSQRSSLRLAIQESLRESTAVATTTHLPSPIPSPSQLSTPASPSDASITPRRRSMRQALKESLRVDTSTASEIIHSATPSPTSSLTSYSTASSSSSSIPSTPSTVATTPRTPATPFPAPVFTTAASTPSPSVTPSKASRKSARLLHRTQHKANAANDDSDSDSDHKKKSESAQYARVNDKDRPNVNGIATPFKGWYRIRTILTETRNRSGELIYLVDWEGVDPRSGVSWPSSWVESKNVSVAAIRAWENLKSQNLNIMA